MEGSSKAHPPKREPPANSPMKSPPFCLVQGTFHKNIVSPVLPLSQPQSGSFLVPQALNLAITRSIFSSMCLLWLPAKRWYSWSM